VGDAAVVRLLTFRPAGDDAVVDAALRSLAFGVLGRMPVSAVFAGRRHEGAGERVVVSLWESLETLVDSLGPLSAHNAAEAERFDQMAEIRVEVLPLAVAVEFERDPHATVLRIFRGRTHPGELDAYVEDVRAGTLADMAAEQGPHALFLGIDPPQGFLTVSVWADWGRIQAATGGNIRNPIATRHAHRLLDGTANHYELLPDAAGESIAASGVR
jgi:hypothetical protein